MEFGNKNYKDTYYEKKKTSGFIFTKNNLKNNEDYTPCSMPEGISWWSKELGRYRTSKEQREFVQKMAGKVVKEEG